jgi:hypothetical protein
MDFLSIFHIHSRDCNQSRCARCSVKMNTEIEYLVCAPVFVVKAAKSMCPVRELQRWYLETNTLN